MEHLGSPYFLFLAIGFACGFLWLVRTGEARGLPRLGLIDVCIAAILGGICGGRLLHVVAEPLPAHDLQPAEIAALEVKLTELDADLDAELRQSLEQALARRPVPAGWQFLAEMPAGAPRRDALEAMARDPGQVPVWDWYRAFPSHVPQFWRGGLAYFGGLVVAIVACLGVTLRHGMPVREVADATAPAIILGLVFGRIGCFLGGCCYGAVCEPAWWATQPGWYAPPTGGVPRYPTALLSAGFAFLLFLALRAIYRRRAFAGEAFLALLVLYAPGRYLIEDLRADPRGGAGGLSTTQLLVLVSGVPALAVWVWGRLTSPGLGPLQPAREPGGLPRAEEPASPAPAGESPAIEGVESPPCPSE